MINNTENSVFKPIYILHGGENFLLHEYVSTLEKKFKEQNNSEQNIKTFDCSVDNVKEIFSFAAMNSLIGAQMIIVKNIQNCKDINNKKVVEFVEKYANKPNPQNILVLCSDKLLPAGNTFLKIFSKSKIERFSKLKDSEINTFIRQRLEPIPINDDAITLLRLLTGDDLQVLSQELEKLTFFKEIDEKIISEYISFQRHYDPFEFLNAIVEKKITLLERILKNNNDIEVIPLVALLYSFFSKIMILHTDKASQETYYQRFYQNAKRNYSLGKIENIMRTLLEVDLQLKGINSNFSDEKSILRNLIFNIVV